MKEDEPKTEEPEVLEKPERTSGIMKIRGASPENEKRILGDIKKDLFDEKFDGKFEREKTPEETEILRGILKNMSGFIKEYGGTPVPLREDHTHIIDREKLTDEQKKHSIPGRFRGKYWTEAQMATVHLNKGDNRLIYAQISAHELIHFNAFQSVDFNKKDNKIESSVDGFTMKTIVDGENEYYFDEVNEAVTAELTKRFCEQYFISIPALAEEIAKRDKFRSGIKKHDLQKLCIFLM